MVDDENRALTADGGAYPMLGRAGVVEGTPTAVITDTSIDQETDGASIQFNWNLEKHKFMVGLSIDAPSATYGSGQRFGMLDANRHAFLAPELIRDQYTAADYEIRNNDFEGKQVTRSIYASETWSPVEALHITGAMRYNETRGKNEMASRTWGGGWRELHTIENHPDWYDVCRTGEECETGYGRPPTERLMNPAEKEEFSYYSLNPSLGVSWQANPNLNIFGNVAQGTRTPSVIELGCAFDDTPVATSGGFMPKSLIEGRSCSMPTTLSGDPYLPQIKATSYDLGFRGKWSENAEWNVGVYRTNLNDDIYMIGYPGNRNFFDTIGKTRREGLEAGISGAFGKWDVSLNYALTKATFEDEFWMPANDNSSSEEEFFGNHEYSRRIKVKPGDRMPGVPLHNLNATATYSVTSNWRVGLSAVAHSFSYVRGNENNKHRAGDIIYESIENLNGPGHGQYPRGRTNNPGTVDGFMVFNFLTSYKLAPEWTLGLQVNNIFDKEYFTAGRLGVNPFAPSVRGAVGVSGYNHNSLDWVNTNFLAPGAPRAAWISLSYEFDPRK
jgi:outer membrane receptor protein involved in Fe transport